MLAGKFPYGIQVAKTRTRAAQKKLNYLSVLHDDREIPAWVDGALEKGLQTDPSKRYSEISEFIYDLRHPNQAFLNKTRRPLMERNPVVFWKSISFVLLLIIVILLAR